VVESNGRLMTVVQVLDCAAAYDPCDKDTDMPAIVASPTRNGKVLGRIRFFIQDYTVTDSVLPVPAYKYRKEDNWI
jgi:hypothetical protein